jgi:hypothetical protein
MNKGTLLLFLSLTVCTSLVARLGETEAELVKRFGKVVQRRAEAIPAQGKMVRIGERLIFHSDDWGINVVMISGRCGYIRYSKPGEWTEAQFTSLLTSNAGSYSWREDSKSRKGNRLWIRDDGTRATWGGYAGLVVTGRTYESAVEAAKKVAKDKSSQVPRF